MNIAIILAVSDYHNINCLPGCKLDAQLMKNLLDTTGKYGELLYLNQNTDSTQIKAELSEFISKNQDKTFDEVFFYYTGHGDFHNDEFYYILSDFDDEKYRQTSLSNFEIDNFLRQLNPKLTVKIIDACYSGVTYIKNKDSFYKHLDDSKKQFSNCYFMFSSMNDQVSFQSKIISHFTKSFIDSVLNYGSTDIRYKHIIDYVSDEFEKNSFQKPFFITFELTVDAPFKLINIEFRPQYPNIDWCDCKIVFVFSQVNIRFFYRYSNFKLETWENYHHHSSSDWQTVEVEIKNFNQLKETISDILSKFESFVLNPLKAKYVLTINRKTEKNS